MPFKPSFINMRKNVCDPITAVIANSFKEMTNIWFTAICKTTSFQSQYFLLACSKKKRTFYYGFRQSIAGCPQSGKKEKKYFFQGQGILKLVREF